MQLGLPPSLHPHRHLPFTASTLALKTPDCPYGFH
jgi:hypothetical protein